MLRHLEVNVRVFAIILECEEILSGDCTAKMLIQTHNITNKTITKRIDKIANFGNKNSQLCNKF